MRAESTSKLRARARGRRGVATLAGVAIAGVALFAGAPSAAADTPPTPEHAVSTSGGGFTLRQPKWKKADSGRNVSLVAKYTWGGKGERSVVGADGVAYWQLVFPDSPKPDETATLVLTFQFELRPEEKSAAVRVANDAIGAAIAVVERALDETAALSPPPTDDARKEAIARAVRARSRTVVDALAPVRDLRTEGGKPGDELVLETIGFHKTASGDWELASLALDKLSEIARRRGEERLAPLEDSVAKTTAVMRSPPAVETSSAGPACQAAVADSLRDKGSTFDGLKKCSAMAVDVWKRQAPARAATSPRAQALLQAVTTLEGMLATVTEDEVIVANASTTGSFVSVSQAVISNGEAIDPQSYSIAALKYFRARVFLANAARSLDADTRRITDELRVRVSTMTQQHVGLALLEQDAEKRRFQASTGIVYVGGLDQVVMPLMISYCVWDGCIGNGKTIFDAGSWKHLLSVDIGARAQVVGERDPRDDGASAFLAGVSLNPLMFVRASVGAYVFENSQTKNWNTNVYVGVSADVLHAVELLGVTGLGVPQPPRVVSTAAVPSTKGP